jgi:hypothetical protein
MKMIFRFFLLGLLLAQFNPILSAKKIKMAGHFGGDIFMLPRQIMATDTEIFVLDEHGNMTSGDEKIKVFSLDGKFKMEFGKGGQGPGEFGEASSFYIHNGKIYILDSRRRMVHLFSEKEKKHLESKKVVFGAPNAAFTTPGEFVITNDKSVYYNAARTIKGQKLITGLAENQHKEFRPRNNFLDCIPIYKSLNEAYSLSPAKRGKPEFTRKGYTNDGYIASDGENLYFSFWLINEVYHLSHEGKILNRYTLPIKSIQKTVPVIKVGQFNTIERKLNYDLLYHSGQVYVLSRDVNGDSVVFLLENGAFKEKYRMKDKLFSFDISRNKLYGIEREKYQVLVYDLN